MGAAGSNSLRLQPVPLESGDVSYGGAVEPPWSLPPAGQVDLSMLVGVGGGLTGSGGGNFGRACRERGDGNVREKHTARLSHLDSSSAGDDDEEGDWLETSLCLSLSSLRREEIVLLIARAKEKLFSSLSCLCYQDDAFCEAVAQRIQTMQSVHAAMTRRRCEKLERESADTIRRQHCVVAPEKDGRVAGDGGPSCAAYGDDVLGLQLFFSLLDFVRDPECGQQQIADFLKQISPVVSSLPPLCLACVYSGSTGNALDQPPTRRTAASSVVQSLLEFLATLALSERAGNDSPRIESEWNSGIFKPTEASDSGQRGVALSAMISLVAARGRASDLLLLVKVLFSAGCRKRDRDDKGLQDEEGQNNVQGAMGSRKEHVMAEFSAKRRPTSRVKTRTSRQGLPVDDDDDDNHEAHGSPVLAHPVVTMAVGPADPTAGGDSPCDPWKSVSPVHVSGGGDSGKSPEGHPIKGRKTKGERVRFTPPVDQQPWQNVNRTSNQHGGVDPCSAMCLAYDEADAIEAKHILPFLCQLHAATPNQDPRSQKFYPVHQREVWTCGQNSYGELGHSDTGTRKVHCSVKAFEGREVVDVAAGNEHTVILCRSGEVYTAGYNDNGQCGQGTTQRVGVLTRVPILAGRRAVQVHAYNGCEHTLVVLDDGRVVSFGYNYRGQLGHGNTASEPVPKLIRGLDEMRVTQASCSYYHTVIACDNGEVYTFGRNDFGQLGSGDTIDRKLPSPVDSLRGQRVASLACGQYHTVVSTLEIGVQSCGKNDYGQLGVESSDFQKNLVVVKGALNGAKVRHLRCGYYHTIVLAAGGHVLGFGRNDYGQLGLGHITQRVFGPKLIEGAEGKGVFKVSTGCYHTVLVGSDGMLYVFGRNHHGQLGTGDTNERHTPFPVDTFLGKHVTKVAAGFYHTIVLTGGSDETSELLAGGLAHTLSPHNILVHPALTLPNGASYEITTKNASEHAEHVGTGGGSPELNSSPVCDRGDPNFSRAAASIGFGSSMESQTEPKSASGICLSDGRISGRKAAVVIMAHMDRLAECFASQKDEIPIIGDVGAGSVNGEANWSLKGQRDGPDGQAGGINGSVYCVDVSPDTFELLAAILAYTSEEERFDDLGEEAHFPKYMILAALRVLKVNLSRLLQSHISIRILASMVARKTCFDFNDANEFQLEGSLGHDSVLDTLFFEAPTSGQAAGMVDGNDTTRGATGGVHVALHVEGDGQDQVGEVCGGDGRVRSEVERYCDVLCTLQRLLLLLVQSEPFCGGNGIGGGAEFVQKEAAAVLILGLELFFSSQAEKFRLLSKLISTTAVGEEDERDMSVGGDFDTIDHPICGLRAARHYILVPLLQRLCNDALASKLIPYGADLDKGCSVCTMVEVLEPALQDYSVSAASARLLEIQVKLLVDLIAQGNECALFLGEPFPDNTRTTTFMPQYQECNPPVPQLNGSATDRTESFGLDTNAAGNAEGDGSDSPVRMQRLFVNFVLTLTKHMMHWAASDRVTVDPTLWQSRVLGDDARNDCPIDSTFSAKGVPGECTEWFAARVKGLFDRAASVILDGVDRTPSSWRCLIKHAQLILKYSNAILESALEGDTQVESEDGRAAEEGDARPVDRLEETLVGLLLPAMVTGLLPFAHVPVFARRLLGVVNTTVGLLDEVCYRCPAIRLADANYIAARNGVGGTPMSKRKPQTLFMRGENGKLGGGAATGRNSNPDLAAVETGAGLKGAAGVTYDIQNLPWLLSLAKTTSLLAGRLAATLVVGDCGISPFLESCFRAPSYAKWLNSDLLTGGYDPFYQELVLAPLDITSQVANGDSWISVPVKTSVVRLDNASVPMSGVARSRDKLSEFLEEVASGYGQGGRFATWLNVVFTPSNAAYQVIKRQAMAGHDGAALERAERAIMAAMLRHGGLDGDAALFCARLERQSIGGVEEERRKPPRRFEALWKSTAEMAGWLWHSRSKLRSADVEQSKIDALLQEAADSCIVLMLFRPAVSTPPAFVAQQSASHASLSTMQLVARRRWRQAAVLIRATIRWRAVTFGKTLKQTIGAVPRFVRAMLGGRTGRRADAKRQHELSRGGSDGDFTKDSVEGLSVLLILVLDNHQRAIARASGLQSLRVLVKALRTRSLLADVLQSLAPAMQTPQLVDRHILTHLSAVGQSVTRRVTATFQALLSKLLRVLKESCQYQKEEGEDLASPMRANGALMREWEQVKTNTCKSTVPRHFDARTVLVLLEIWGLTIHPQDWAYIETVDVIGVVSCVAAAQCRTDDGDVVETEVGVDSRGRLEPNRDDERISRKGRATQPRARAAVSKHGQRPLATCKAAAWTLFRALLIQLHGAKSTTATNSNVGDGLQHLASIVEVIRAELAKCVSKQNTNASVASGRPKHAVGGRGEGADSQHRDRTPSQAILEFSSPLIGGFPDSPPHARAAAGGKVSAAGGSHKRRCQELVSSPCRLMNMEDGLMFPAEHVLSNPRASDFSITFWLLLVQDRTGYHRTVLARGNGSERWPVVLLRNTDNRLEVCFGVPSMGNLCERLTSKEPVRINRWTHVGLISEHNKLRLYVNGVLDSQRTSTGAVRANRHPLYVGKVPDGAMRLDGVRGGLEGSIANLRYFTRALSPIHVRIICDPGPPETAKVEDRHCYSLCACLVAISKSPQCRQHLQHADWMKLLLRVFTYGTTRVQQAVCRLLRELLPHVSPLAMGNVVLGATRSNAAAEPLAPCAHGDEDEETLHTAFAVYLLRLIGAGSWYVGATNSTADEAARVSHNVNSEECDLTVAQVVLRGQVARFLPLTIAPACARRDQADGESTSVKKGSEAGRGVRMVADATMAARQPSSPLSAEMARDTSTLGAELVALVQTLAVTNPWGQAVALALKRSLGHLMSFIHTTGGFMFPNRSGDRDATLECATTEEQLAVAGGEAVLQVLGGTVDFLCVGICARVRETDQQCTVLSVDKATSTVNVVLHQEGGEAVEKWFRRFSAHDLEVQGAESLARGAMVAFSSNFAGALHDDGAISGTEYIAKVATAFLRSSPLPRRHLASGAEHVHNAHMIYREIVLAQCRSRLVRAILRASRDDQWASSTVQTSDLFAELLRISVLPRSTLDAAIGEDFLVKAETVAIQERLRQTLGAPGGRETMAGKIAEMMLNPKEGTSRKEHGRDGGDPGGRERDGTNHRCAGSSMGRAWVNSLGCPFCREQKTTASGIVEHVLTEHSADMRRVPCPVCVAEKGDVTAHDLPTHLELVHFDAILRDRRPFSQALGERRRDSGGGRLEARPPSHLVEQLMVIGFPRDWCHLALRENDNDVVNASAWIVDNLDMLSTLNNLDASSGDRVGEADDTMHRIRHENDRQLWQGRYRFAREGLARGAGRVLGENNRVVEEEEQEFGDEGREETYGEEDEFEGENTEEGNEDEREQETKHGGNEEEEEEEEEEEDEDGDGDEEEEDDGDEHDVDEEGEADRQAEEVLDSEEEDEEDEEDDEVARSRQGYGVRGIEHHQQIIVAPPPRSPLDDTLDNEQREIAQNHRIADGLVMSDRRESYFPAEHGVTRTPGSSPHRGSCSSIRSQLAAVSSHIAGMELCQLTEVWLYTELHLTALYCRAALVNMLLRWPPQVSLCVASLRSSATVVTLIQSLLFGAQDLPIKFTNDEICGGVLQPVPNGARPPTLIGVFAPLLLHLLRSERNEQRSTGASMVSEVDTGADTEEDRTLAGAQAGQAETVSERGEWGNTLSARLVTACLDELDAAAAADAFADIPWAATEPNIQSNRLAADGKPNLELLQWLLDLLLAVGCADVFTETVFSRLSNCLNSPNVAVKEVAVYALTSIATKWCEHLAIDADQRCGGDSGPTIAPIGLPSPLAMEETFQRHMAISRVRSALARRIDVERRPGGLFFTRYTQTLTALYVAMCRLQRLLLSHRRRSSFSQSPGGLDFSRVTDVSTPTILYCTDSSIALTWLPLHKAASASSIIYEVQMAARQLGIVESQEVFRCVYAGKRLRCRVDDLMPGQAYHFRLRAVHPTTKTTPWSAVVTAETEQGIAFRFDSANSGPSIFVSSNELSASFGSNETWSTILGTCPFITGSNYWELHLDKSATAYLFIGVATRDADLKTFLGGDDNGWGFIGDRALYHKRTKVKAYGERFGQGDTIGITLNMDRGNLSFSKNGQDLGVAFEGLVGSLYPAVAFYNQGQRLSLVQSSFRCAGAGVTILGSPLSTTPENVLTVYNVMEAMVSGKALLPAWMEVARAGHLAWVTGRTVRHPTSLGFELQFDVCDASCRRFGLRARGRVRTPRGNATVIGTCEGVMWFDVDGERGAWFFTAGEIWEARATGCFVMESSDVLDANGIGECTRWRLLDGERTEQHKGNNSAEVEAAHEVGSRSSTLDSATSGSSEADFAAIGDCAKWTPTVDGCIVEALCNHADSRQVSVWNLTPAQVLEILSPVRRRLELLLKSDAVVDDDLLYRVSILKQFNHEMVGVLPFADLAEGVQVSGRPVSRTFCWGGSSRHRGLAVGGGGHQTRGLGPLLVCLRRSIFLATKQQALSRAVGITTTHAKKAEDEYDYPEDLPQVTVNRLNAAAGQASPDAETRLRASVFHQLYRELHALDTSLLRMGYTHPMDDGQQRTFKVKFEGEGVDDYGGPYREIFTQVAEELTSTVSSVLRDNTEHTVGATSPEDDECLLPILEPAPRSSTRDGCDVGVEFMVKANVHQQRHLSTYKFLGQLVGIALRCQVAAPWRLSQAFWKGLVGEAVQKDDLAHIKLTAHACILGIHERITALKRKIEGGDDEPDVTCLEDSAAGSVLTRASKGSTWTGTAGGKTVGLKPGGQNIAVKPSELLPHLQEVAHARLHEYDMALFAVRDGLASVVPAAILPIFTWEEVELQACGRPGVDIDLLQANTEYDDDMSASDPHIQSFWRVLRAFDDRDRSQFLRFVWARSRLPSKAADFHQKFKIHSLAGDGAREDPDQYLPKAHTCFFSINLPRYSSDEIMNRKLRYTMHNCIEMDADFRLADNEMSGWGNDPALQNNRGHSGGDGANIADQLL